MDGNLEVRNFIKGHAEQTFPLCPAMLLIVAERLVCGRDEERTTYSQQGNRRCEEYPTVQLKQAATYNGQPHYRKMLEVDYYFTEDDKSTSSYCPGEGNGNLS